MFLERRTSTRHAHYKKHDQKNGHFLPYLSARPGITVEKSAHPRKYMEPTRPITLL